MTTLELRSNGRRCCPECGSNTCCGSIHCPEHDEILREKKLEEKAYANATFACEQKCAEKCQEAFLRGKAEKNAELTRYKQDTKHKIFERTYDSDDWLKAQDKNVQTMVKLREDEARADERRKFKHISDNCIDCYEKGLKEGQAIRETEGGLGVCESCGEHAWLRFPHKGMMQENYKNGYAKGKADERKEREGELYLRRQIGTCCPDCPSCECDKCINVQSHVSRGYRKGQADMIEKLTSDNLAWQLIGLSEDHYMNCQQIRELGEGNEQKERETWRTAIKAAIKKASESAGVEKDG
jgi:hypothetical protein